MGPATKTKEVTARATLAYSHLRTGLASLRLSGRAFSRFHILKHGRLKFFKGPGLDLTHYQYGVVAGIAVYAVPQVVAASFAVSSLSGQVAMLVKLVRVLFLGPMIIVLGLLHRGNADDSAPSQSMWQRTKLYVPWFVAGFLLLAALRSSGVIPEGSGDDAKVLSKLLFVVAMVGLGIGVDLKKVGAVGPRVAATILAAMGFMIIVSLVGTSVLDLRG